MKPEQVRQAGKAIGEALDRARRNREQTLVRRPGGREKAKPKPRRQNMGQRMWWLDE